MTTLLIITAAAIAFGFVLGVICISFAAKRLYKERKKKNKILTYDI